MTAPDPPATDAGTRPPRPRGTFRLVLLGVLVLALLASAGCLVWLLAERRGAADRTQSERDAALRQAEQFVLRLNTYGPGQLDDQGRLPGYRQQVSEVITPKFAADFERSGLPIAEQIVVKQRYGRTAEVYGAGVESIGPADATVIVAAGLTGSYPDPQHPKDRSQRVETDPDVLRWEVDLVRSDGDWRVDDYAPVSEERR
ncbi:hypothetical protein KM427_04760 [Nocardioides sp. LMS-CY]|uniref:hypothetical protein n=1 Tax=Nocardioides sp. (strain LMS-CY) TaxID=2840457 RepID=UPI001C0002B4|nr:hypothetical protein [Nocardioides sp. LMS-CY]QWF23045.1 hypothetical protein KM427_04760 [Nocardioides sp. LMS-CY]